MVLVGYDIRHCSLSKIYNKRKIILHFPPQSPEEDLFMHISDIEGEFVPRRGDRVSFRKCPLPPKFEKCQAVHVHILEVSPDSPRQRWEMPETPEELEEEKNIQSLPYDV